MRGEANAYAAALECVAVELLLGVLGVETRVQLDEAKAALCIQKAFAHFAKFGKEFFEVAFSDVGGQVADEEATAARELLLAALIGSAVVGICIIIIIIIVVVSIWLVVLWLVVGVLVSV